MSNAHVYLVRHGRALTKEKDPRRSLTPIGKEQAQKMGNWLAGQIEDAALQIYHSDRDRARQTAEIISGELENAGKQTTVVLKDGLAPKDDIAPIAAWLGTVDRPTMVVAHLPFLKLLLQQLTKGDTGEEVFAECAVACLTGGDDGFTVEFTKASSEL
jgi:phosphohistidine phosphatase SixA